MGIIPHAFNATFSDSVRILRPTCSQWSHGFMRSGVGTIAKSNSV